MTDTTPVSLAAEWRRSLRAQGGALLRLATASLVINLLMLVPTLYMLQVYDRVMASHSELTLLAVSLIAALALGLMALTETWRSRWLVRTSLALEAQWSGRVFEVSLIESLNAMSTRAAQALGDLTAVRQFLIGPGVYALFDAPWLPVYVAVLWLLHPMLGGMALVFGALQLSIAAWSHHRSVAPIAAAQTAAQAETQWLHSTVLHAEVVEVLGMAPAMRGHWLQRRSQQRVLAGALQSLSRRLGGLSRYTRQVQQSFSLGLGAWLVIHGELSPGAMIAANVLMTRALSPVDGLVGVWRQAITARQSFVRLSRLLAAHPGQAGLTLDGPLRGELVLRDVCACVPGAEAPVLDHLNLSFEPGSVTVVMGPSGAGKSTLARVAAGVWPDLTGEVLLDGVPMDRLCRSEAGRQTGYLPQDVVLLDGSVAQNIARLGEPDPVQVIAAAQATGLHEAILRLPRGYDTPVGDAGHLLSGGQRQRIGLARAVYGQPKLVVLDEPNAHLDEIGEQALAQLVLGLRAQGATVLLVTHRPAILAAADRVVVLQAGRVRLDGPRDEVLAVLHPPEPARPAAPAAVVVPPVLPRPPLPEPAEALAV